MRLCRVGFLRRPITLALTFPPRSSIPTTQVLSVVLGANVHSQTAIFVHEPCLTPDVGFVNFHGRSAATDFGSGFVLHSQTDSLQHEPCSLLGNADGSGDLVGANPGPAIREHQDSNEPLVKRDCGSLKDGSHIAAKLTLCALALALPK